MKRFKQIFLTVIFVGTAGLLLSGCTPSNEFFYEYKRGDCYAQKFDDPDPRLDIDLEWKKDSLWLYWDEYTEDDFEGYYIIKDDTEECPYYFIGRDYHEYIGRSSKTYFQDTSVSSGQRFWYRVCVKTENKAIDCGGVTKVELY